MDQMKRFAVYYAPRKGKFADRTDRWLGWDPARGQAVAQDTVPGIADPAAIDSSSPPPRPIAVVM